jgi:hypothetical protein
MICAVLGAGVLGTGLTFNRLGWRSFSEPPKLGEKSDAIIERLGPPHYDSRDSTGDGDHDYGLGYIDGLGTRHHLRVKDGVVTEITYSSR